MATRVTGVLSRRYGSVSPSGYVLYEYAFCSVHFFFSKRLFFILQNSTSFFIRRRESTTKILRFIATEPVARGSAWARAMILQCTSNNYRTSSVFSYPSFFWGLVKKEVEKVKTEGKAE